MRWRSRGTTATVAINMRPIRSSWGGGNQWNLQLTAFLRQTGYRVRHDLKRPVDCIVMADPRNVGTVSFGVNEISRYLDDNPHTTCVHRINENDLHRGSDYMDDLLAEANAIADHTVFISAWLRDYHAQKWFDSNKDHSVIHNGADPSIYHPIGSRSLEPGGNLVLVTHHWSANWLKGFSVYQRIDEQIASGRLPRTEFWVIGNWPDEVKWRAANTFEPAFGSKLAETLRRCHVYVTASKWEPGGMHFIEGLQCGLPVLYHEDGGGIVEVAAPFGLKFQDDPLSAVCEMRDRYAEFRGKAQRSSPSGDHMCVQYRRLIQSLVAATAERAAHGG